MALEAVEKETKVGRKVGKSDQLIEITVDDSVEKIIQLDTDGKRLRFNPSPDLFKQLASDEVSKLSEFGKFAYQIARDEWTELKDARRAEEEDLLANIEVGVSMGRASHRLRIEGQQQGMEYRWIRPDERNEWLAANRGWTIVKDGPERTLSNQKGRGPHVIGTKGSEELLLVKRSATAGNAERRAKKLKKRAEGRAMDAEYRAAIEREGVPSIGEDDGHGLNWRDRTGDE